MCEASIKQGILGGRKITYISKTCVMLSIRNHKLVSKDSFLQMAPFSEMGRFLLRGKNIFSMDFRLTYLGLQMTLYADPSYLRSLQGNVIPEIIGLYLVDGAISVAMELPSSTFWVEASDDMSDHLKRKCIAAFDEVHSRGVLHDDVELRHMLVSAAGEVTLIDFQMSRALKPKYEVGLQRATEAEFRLEKRKILYKLDFDNARWKENAKRTRVMTRRERNNERRRRRKHLPLGTKPGPEDEYELDDRDDIINPIVDDMIWLRLWVGDEFTPSCYVVPGQDEQKVDAMLKDFAMREILRLEEEEKEKEEQPRRSQANMSSVVSTSYHRPSRTRSLSSSLSSSEKAMSDPTQTEPSKAAVLNDEDNGSESKNTPSTRSPVLLPMRVSPTPSRGTKRTRDSTEDDINCSEEGDVADTNNSDLPPAHKKRLTDSVASALESSGSSTTPVTANCAPTLPTAPSSWAPSTEESLVPAFALPSLPSLPSPSFPPSVFPFVEDRNIVIVPYENYDGIGGFKARNLLSDEDLAEFRRHWIRQYNMRQFLEEGVVHPEDELFKDLPIEMNSDSDDADADAGTKKRKRKSIMGRGALKRFKREADAPGKAKLKALKRKERYFNDRALELGWDPEEDGDLFSDSDDELSDSEELEEVGYDNIPEGPRILTSSELEARETEIARGRLGSQAIARAPAFTLSSGSVAGLAGPSSTVRSAPGRGILRRQLTVEEKSKQRIFEETLLLTGLHPNQVNVIDEDEDDRIFHTIWGPATAPRPSIRRPRSMELQPLMKPYTEALEVVPVSTSSSKAKGKQPPVTVQPGRYTSALPESHMFSPGAQPKAILTARTLRSTNSLTKKRPLRTPAASFCAFTGACAKFPPSPTRVSLPPFPAVSFSEGTRASTIPFSSSLRYSSPFPTSSSVSQAAATASRSFLAQAPQTGASGSDVTMEDLYVGSHIGNAWVAPEPSSVTTDGHAPPSGPAMNPGLGTEELIGAAIATAPLENNGLDSEDEEQIDVDDSTAIGNAPLASHLHSIAKALFSWLR